MSIRLRSIKDKDECVYLEAIPPTGYKIRTAKNYYVLKILSVENYFERWPSYS